MHPKLELMIDDAIYLSTNIQMPTLSSAFAVGGGVFFNGQLIIRRNGMDYNALGKSIKTERLETKEKSYMRKFLSVIVIVLLTETLYAQGQMAALIHLNANVFECGSLQYKDGRVEEYKFVSIPRANMASIAVSNESKTKGIKEVDVNELVSVTIWHEKFPEKKTTLYHVEADKVLLLPTNVWGFPIASSEWGTLYQCYLTYTMYVDCGNLEGDLYIVDGVPDPIYCYLQCRDF